ncbi:hypothetical protein JX265_006229 [Neoarthrinium moseri]|uniref:CFEM domain-containing protein n=1 Tax=Neoarthrinium moseri TaxID=1658444 RepID=A0A9P9WMA6_9PEZI|nr:hypothetical protein JX265_006229 [Neoarthrinium moseri]
MLLTFVAFLLLGAEARKGEGHTDLMLPDCVSGCIKDSGCGPGDVKCMCKASRGSFLVDVVECMHSDCTTRAIPVDDLLSSLENACNAIGRTIPASAISSAEAAQSTIDNPKPTSTVLSETITTETSNVQTTYPATSKPDLSQRPSSTTVAESATKTSISTSTSTSVKSSGQVSATTRPSTAKASTTEFVSESATSTDTGGPVDPTDSSPFAAPMASGRKEQASVFGAVLGMAAIIAFGW